MPSETFYCPHCRRQLTKSAQAYVMGEIYTSKSSFISTGPAPGEVFCPGCHGKIDAMRMIKGEYDADPVMKKYGWLYTLMVVAAITIFKTLFHWSWVASILVGLIVGALMGQIIADTLQGMSKKQNSW